MQEILKITRDELIGCQITITDAKNNANLGITGKVIDETKHFIIIRTAKAIKKIHKKGNTFQITYLGKKVNIKGDLLFGSPEERIKGGKWMKNVMTKNVLITIA